MAQTRQQRRRENIHRQKLFKGRTTAEEVHAKHGFPAKARCNGCQAKYPTTRAITMAPFKDALKQWPELGELPPEAVMTLMVELKGSDGTPDPYIRLGVAYSCKSCRAEIAKSLAKMPSWVLVEFNHGPGADNPLVAVPA